eukprot:Em0063g17a
MLHSPVSQLGSRKIDTPFHEGKNLFHHMISSLASTLSQDLIKRVISCSLSGGNRSCWSAMLIVMPRNVMVVAGPSSLSKATGIPSFSHTLSMVSVDSLQVGYPGGPARRKSSRFAGIFRLGCSVGHVFNVLALARLRDPEGAGRVALPGPPCFPSSQALPLHAENGVPHTLTFLIPYGHDYKLQWLMIE